MNSNPYFSSHTETYVEGILSIQSEFYQNAGRFLNAYLSEGGRVLDIGNGGVINYDHSRLAHLDCAELIHAEEVETGRSIWIMGKRIPKKITPCGAWFYVLQKI